MDRVQAAQAKNGSPDVRGLKALVIGLGVLIVLGTAVVIGVVVKRIVESTSRPALAAGLPVPGATAFRTVLPGGPGAKIAGVTSARGMVAIWLRDSRGGQVVLIDPRTGAISGTIALPHLALHHQ